MVRTCLSEQEQFIIDWIGQNGPVSTISVDFHDAFYAKFGGMRVEKYYGAPVKKATQAITRLCERGMLVKKRVKFPHADDSMPHHGLLYAIPDGFQCGNRV